MLTNNIFSCFIDNDNQKIIITLKKLKIIYGKFLKRKKLYYFLQYYIIATKITTNDLISLVNENHKNDVISYYANNDEQNNYLHIYSNNICTNNTSSQLIHDSYQTSIGHSLLEDKEKENNPFFSRTERVSMNNNFKKVNKSLINNENENMMDIFMKNSLNSNYNTKNKRTASYGHLEVKNNRNDLYKVFKNNESSNTFNNKTQFLQGIIPSYTMTTPNGILYPVIFTNNNNITEDNLNNNLLYNYNTPINSNELRKTVSKPSPSYCYTTFFSPINQIPIIQNNNYSVQMPKYLNNNNSSNINSIPFNNYTEDYLNKQIDDFVNANTLTKQNIISNISKKHHFNLNKSNGAIKINDDKNKAYNNNDKNIKRKNKSLGKINIRKTNKLISDIKNNDIISKGKQFQHTKYSKLYNIKDNKERSSISTNDINIVNDLSINNKSNNKNNDTKNEVKYKKKINKINNNYTNFTKKKNIKNNISFEYNKSTSKKQKEPFNDIKKMNKNTKNKIIRNNNYNEFSQEEKKSYKSFNINGDTNSFNINKRNIISFENDREIINPSQYAISNVVDEEFKQEESKENREEEQNENNRLKMSQMSMQSINDSKMLEMASNYIEDDMDIFDKGRINDILNDKNTRKTFKKNM